jgi:predicted PurR-regulated permease PerM
MAGPGAPVPGEGRFQEASGRVNYPCAGKTAPVDYGVFFPEERWMKREYFLISLFFLISAISFYLFYQVIIPFFIPIAWAAVLTILFFPLYERILRRVKRRGLASLIICTIIIVLIIGPLTYIFVALVNEAAAAVAKVNQMSKSGELDRIIAFDLPWLDTMKQKLSEYYDISKINMNEIVKDAIDAVSKVLLAQTSWIIANGTRAIFYFVLMIFSMYYFFKDGEAIVHKIRRLMPLSPSQITVTFSQLRDVIQATMYGGVAVALLQGLLGGILFAAVGIPSAVFWGAIMAFLSILPIVGAFLVYLPAGVILILGGSLVKGLIVIIIGSVVISQVDSFLRPLLMAGKAAMHPLLLFFAIMGGIALFGLLGIVMGPMIAAIFLTILKVFEFKLHPETEAELADEQT